MKTIIQKLGGDGHTNRMLAAIHRAGIAAPVSEKARKGIMAAGREVFAQHVSSSHGRLCHAATLSGLLAADLRTPQ